MSWQAIIRLLRGPYHRMRLKDLLYHLNHLHPVGGHRYRYEMAVPPPIGSAYDYDVVHVTSDSDRLGPG